MTDQQTQVKVTLGQQLQQLAKDPLQLRAVFCGLTLVLAWLAVLHPLGNRIAQARTARAAAEDLAQRAENALHYVDQIAAFAPLAVADDNTIDWQDYVIEKLDRAHIRYTTFEPRDTEVQRLFKVVEFEVVADVPTYAQIWDFLDRIEHGERLVRVEELALVPAENAVNLRCLIRGLVKPEDSAGFRVANLPQRRAAPAESAPSGEDEASGDD